MTTPTAIVGSDGTPDILAECQTAVHEIYESLGGRGVPVAEVFCAAHILLNQLPALERLRASARIAAVKLPARRGEAAHV